MLPLLKWRMLKRQYISFASTSNHRLLTQQDPAGIIEVKDTQRRSTGTVPDCTEIRASCVANASSRHLKKPSIRRGLQRRLKCARTFEETTLRFFRNSCRGLSVRTMPNGRLDKWQTLH